MSEHQRTRLEAGSHLCGVAAKAEELRTHPPIGHAGSIASYSGRVWNISRTISRSDDLVAFAKKYEHCAARDGHCKEGGQSELVLNATGAGHVLTHAGEPDHPRTNARPRSFRSSRPAGLPFEA